MAVFWAGAVLVFSANLLSVLAIRGGLRTLRSAVPFEEAFFQNGTELN